LVGEKKESTDGRIQFGRLSFGAIFLLGGVLACLAAFTD
jgi:hypothetical protein